MEITIKGHSKIFIFAIIGVIMICSSYLIYFYDPLQAIIQTAVKISDGSISFKIWQRPPYEILLSVYVFNVTNYEEFLAGTEKLRFEEVGPYTFQEMLTNTKATFNDNGTLTYMPKRTVKFLRDKSVGDPAEDVILVPNVPLLGIASMLHQSSMWWNLAVLGITNTLNSQPILNMTVDDYFWGYEDRLVHMASKILPNWIFFEKFGILDRLFDEGNNTVTINVDPNRRTGSMQIDEQERGRLYSILTWNGSPGLAHWGYKQPLHNETIATNTKCNTLEGAYDGTIYPPNIREDAVFRLYRKVFCRTVPIEFDHRGFTPDNYEAFYYKITDNFLDKYEDNPENECYCKDKSLCLPKGLGDTTPCYYGFPTAVSLPHFLNVDPSVAEKVDGLLPDEEKHSTSILINPDVGLLLKGHSRMQVNLVMHTTKYNAKTKPFNNMVLPLFWSEMRVDDMPPEVKTLMHLIFKVLPIVQLVLMYLLAILGAAFVATAGILVFLTMGVAQPSPSLNLGYTPIRVIPVIRRESLLNELRRISK